MEPVPLVPKAAVEIVPPVYEEFEPAYELRPRKPSVPPVAVVVELQADVEVALWLRLRLRSTNMRWRRRLRLELPWKLKLSRVDIESRLS